MTEERAEFGIIGLGVMGRNLARNLGEHGVSLAVWNREVDDLRQFLAERPEGVRYGCESLREFVSRLRPPRRIWMMIPAGAPVTQMLDRLTPMLDPGDVVMDGGNSLFSHTRERAADLAKHGVHFFGIGVSGGEEGARKGPSLMVGGPREAYPLVEPVLASIAAESERGRCVAHLGPDGAGHFVKMAHNGIEYADMQLLAEAFDLLRRGLDLDHEAVADRFERWNSGPLASFLVEITAKILRVKEADGVRPLVDLVLDRAGQKGTGRWTIQEALALGVPVPTLAAAVDARVVSSLRALRLRVEDRIPGPSPRTGGKTLAPEDVGDALLVGRICAFAQGMELIRAASDEYGWGVPLAEVARIWTNGCILRARILHPILAAYERDPELPNLVLNEELGGMLRAALPAARRVTAAAVELGIPVPALSACVAYVDAIRSPALPQNLTQAQRDAFGAHGYERIDRPDEGPFHTDWLRTP